MLHLSDVASVMADCIEQLVDESSGIGYSYEHNSLRMVHRSVGLHHHRHRELAGRWKVSRLSYVRCEFVLFRKH